MDVFFPSDSNQELFLMDAKDLGLDSDDLIDNLYSVSIPSNVIENNEYLLDLIHAYDGYIED